MAMGFGLINWFMSFPVDMDLPDSTVCYYSQTTRYVSSRHVHRGDMLCSDKYHSISKSTSKLQKYFTEDCYCKLQRGSSNSLQMRKLHIGKATYSLIVEN